MIATARRLLVCSMALLSWSCWAQHPGKGMVVILLGPPGSGKTTQAELLKKEYKIPYLSTAEALKQQHDRKSAISRSMKAERASGSFLSDEGVNELMSEYIKRFDFSRGFILDGYPASRAQANYFVNMLSDMKLAHPVTIVLNVPDNVARQRLAKRGRADDATENVEKRLADYHIEASAIRSAYPSGSIFQIDADRPVAEVNREIRKILDSYSPSK